MWPQVRSTEIVKAAFVAGTLPPDFSISLLSGTLLKPTILGTSTILELEVYVKQLEFKFLLEERTEQFWGAGRQHLLNISL